MLTKTKLVGLIFGILMLCVGCSTEKKTELFGQELTLTETTEISGVLADPVAFLGKTVQIEGTVVDVCQNQGCWIEISAAEPGQILKVKVNDGDIVFPVRVKGKKIVAEGELYKIDLDEEQAIAYLEHLAEEQGEPFDATEVGGPLTIYQIKGHGARIEQ